MERKTGISEIKSSKADQPDDHDDWQIDPLAGYKKSDKKVKDKKKEDQEKGPMGFDEWSVSWP
ncbi:hypothetical protein [Pedobacter sp. KLB.chiD]|uniref:hypothetical protein n=1 Tax=Pedobacter sp. KLB.chiD TaxID=3387402 RepID=UPI00399AB26F